MLRAAASLRVRFQSPCADYYSEVNISTVAGYFGVRLPHYALRDSWYQRWHQQFNEEENDEYALYPLQEKYELC